MHDKTEVELVPMRVGDQWLHVYIGGEDTSWVLHVSDLGELSTVINKYRMKAAMAAQLGGSVS